MKVTPDKRLFWFLRPDIELDLSNPSIREMYIQQVITAGRTEDIKNFLKSLLLNSLKNRF